MTPKMRLRWWVFFCCSIAATIVGGLYYGPAVFKADPLAVGMAGGIISIYFIITAWIGIAMHTGREIPSRWARHAILLFPALGLIGAVMGMMELFAFSSSGTGGLDNATILAGISLVLVPTLVGLIYSEALGFQLLVWGDDDA